VRERGRGGAMTRKMFFAETGLRRRKTQIILNEKKGSTREKNQNPPPAN